MKNFYTFLTALVCPIFMWAQQGVNYQAAVRDASGTLLTNQNVTAEFSIVEGSSGGTVVYSESHSATTNAYGLINVIIGQGTVVSGDFSTIDWGANTHFLDITLDGNNLGAMEFQAVPYSFNSKSMTNIRANTSNADVDITSTDSNAKVLIRPTANQTNDSTTLFLGEGSIPQNGMGFLYDGSSNNLHVIGGSFAQPNQGPYMTINRDSGTSTFTSGVVVEEETSTPTPRTVYGNTGPLAYGVFADGLIDTDYGITSFSNPSTGVYEVILDNNWAGVPVVIATSFNLSSDTEVITYSTSGTNTVIIRIVDENNTPTVSNFSLVVFGSAQ